VTALALGVVTIAIQGYRLSQGPDIFSDEGVYLLVGKHIAEGLGVIGDNGQPFFFHPPLYMVLEAAFIKVSGIQGIDPVPMLFSVRWLNVGISGASAALLVFIGRHLLNLRTGAVMAIVFLLDPYIQRINRRSMLETLAMFMVLLGVYAFIALRGRASPWRWVAAGSAFGLAALTKEAMLAELLVIPAFAAWAHRDDLRDAIRTVGVALAVYAVYPLWALFTGQGGVYLAFTLFAIERVFYLVTLRGQPKPPPGSHLLTGQQALSITNLEKLFGVYALSYALIALALVATVILVIRFRARLEARYVATWSVTSFLVDALLGKLSDQAFYYLVVVCVVVVSYTALTLAEQPVAWLREVSRGGAPSARTAHRRLLGTLLAGGLLMAGYNSTVWLTTKVVGSDDAYTSVLAFTEARVPVGSTIDLSNEVPKYFLPDRYRYNLRLDRSVAVINALHERYFILSSVDAEARLEDMTPELYQWVLRNTRPLFVTHDATFGTLGLYYRPSA
jgi:4-amino-4-deoxy-L-arabinose transferase-like glycosyltransferase